MREHKKRETMKKLFLAAVLASGAMAGDVMTPLQFANYCENNGGVAVNALFDESNRDETFQVCRDQHANIIAMNVKAFSITRADKPESIRAFEKLSREVKIEEAVRVSEMSKLEWMRMGAEKATK